MRKLISGLVFIILTVAGCGGGSGGGSPPPPTSTAALQLFDEVWADFDANYSFFVLKGIDWQALRTQYRSQLDSQSPDSEAYDVTAAMLLELEDGHVRIESPFGTSTYTGWFDRFPENFDRTVVSASYLGSTEQISPQANLTYGLVAPGIGYVHVNSLGGSGYNADIEFIAGQLGAVQGLIVDLRNNGGGNDQNGQALVGRLTSTSQVYRRVRFRDGPNHDDFGPFIDSSTTSVPPTLFNVPIAVLTNRRTASSAESLVLAFRTLPNVVTIGDFTGGISANPALRTMTNGWRYTVSRWIEYLPDNSTFEGIGLEPDIRVDITPADQAVQRDSIIEAAIAVIQ